VYSMRPELVEGPSTSSRRWPVLNSLQGYQGTWLRSYLIAGLTAAITMPLARGDGGRYVALSAALAICTGPAGKAGRLTPR
jgi:MFS superfamily sulfate permease-like transporter